MKLKKKRKRNQIKPKLSTLNKLLYYIILALMIISLFALTICGSILNKVIGLSPADTVAFSERFAMLKTILLFPFFIYIIVVGFVYWDNNYSNSKPIIGKPKIPLINIPNEKPSEKALKRFYRKILIIILIICILPIPFAFRGYNRLFSNNDIVVYDIFENEKEHYTQADYSHLEIKTIPENNRYGLVSSVDLSIVITAKNGNIFSFSMSEFRSNDIALDEMLRIKSYFEEDEISYSIYKDLEFFIEKHNYNAIEAKKLYKLFEK